MSNTCFVNLVTVRVVHLSSWVGREALSGDHSSLWSRQKVTGLVEARAALQLVDTSAHAFCRLELRGLRLLSAEALPFDMPDEIPSSHYYLRSLSRTSGTLLLPRFSGPPRGSQEDFLGRERGGVPRGSSRTLGDPPWGSLSAKEVLREPRGGPENLGRRRVLEVRDTEPRGGPENLGRRRCRTLELAV